MTLRILDRAPTLHAWALQTKHPSWDDQEFYRFIKKLVQFKQSYILLPQEFIYRLEVSSIHLLKSTLMDLKDLTFKTCFVAALIMLVFSLSFGEGPTARGMSLPSMKQAYKAEFLAVLSGLMGKTIDPNDPKAIQASEAFFAIDATKSYSFTRIHGIALEFCPDDTALKHAMGRYLNAAKMQIALGEIYYAEGFDLMLGQERMVKSGQELTDGLNEMLESIRQAYREADPELVEEMCRESLNALTALADFYRANTGKK